MLKVTYYAATKDLLSTATSTQADCMDSGKAIIYVMSAETCSAPC